jgi:hypothetical protein
MAGPCEHGNEPLDSIRCTIFRDKLNNYNELFKKDIALLSNVKLYLCLTKYHVMKTYGGVEI